MKLKLSIIAFISIAFFAIGIKLVIACADIGSPFDMYVSFFQNNITAEPEYKPFHYTDYTSLYDAWYYDELPEDDDLHDGNIEEWHTYSKKAAKRADIDSFMNKFSEKDVRALFQKTPNIPAKVSGNSFSKFLVLDKNRELLEYLLFAKKCEPLNANLESFWDNTANTYKTPEKPTNQLWPLIEEGGMAFLKTKNDFLKWRYAYQVLRLAMYSGNYQTTLKLYDKMIGSKTAKNLMYPKCLGLKAGALYHTHKKKQAAYLYSRAFDLSDDMKRNSFLSFLWATDSIKIADVQALCKNNHEKAVLMVMDGLFEKSNETFEGLGVMQIAYTLDPNVKGLGVVMTREINKAEQRYLQKREEMERNHGNWSAIYSFYYRSTEEDKKTWEQEKDKYHTYLDGLNRFAVKIAADTKTADKAFWLLASSNISFLEDKFADSKQYLDLAAKEKMNPHEHDVHDVINILCVVHRSDRITTETEAELLPCLKWVERREGKSMRFSKVYRDLLSTILTDKYMAQKDTTKAVYCLARANKDSKGAFYVSEDFTDNVGGLLENMSLYQLHELQDFVKRNDKTDFEKWLTYKTPYPASVLRELEGTKYIREMKFGKAVAVLNGLPQGTLSKTVLPDVLINHLQDSQDWNASDSAKTYNKLQFAQKMLELETALDKDPKNSRLAYKYANGLYNMSYYGRAHHAFDYYRSTCDDNAYFASAERNKMPDYKKEYYGLTKALKYYLAAFNNSKDAEVKARCLFMAAKCWQKNCPVTGKKKSYELYDDKTYYKNALKNPYLAKLCSEYKGTELYSSAFTSCSYLRDYTHKH